MKRKRIVGYCGLALLLAVFLVSSAAVVEAEQKLTVKYPTQIVKEETTVIKGQVPEQTEKVQLKVDGWVLTTSRGDRYLQPKNNNYALRYSFNKAGSSRNLVVSAYDKYGNLITKVSREIDVLESRDKVDSTLTVNFPEKIIKGQKITISGKASSKIEKVQLAVDGWVLTDSENNEYVPVNNGKYSLNYEFGKAEKNRNLVVKGFDQNGVLVARKEAQIDILTRDKSENCLQITSPEVVKVDQEFTIKGKVSYPVKKVKIIVDKWTVAEQKVDSGTNQLQISLNSLGLDRKLIVKGYDQRGNLAKKVNKEINVLGKKGTTSIHQQIYDYLMVRENREDTREKAVELHKEILGAEGTAAIRNTCAFFASEVLRRMGISESKLPENVCRVNGDDPELSMQYHLEQLGWKKGYDLSQVKPGYVMFSEAEKHVYYFMKWKGNSRDYAYIVDNQGQPYYGYDDNYHVRNITDVGSKTPFRFYMYQPGSSVDKRLVVNSSTQVKVNEKSKISGYAVEPIDRVKISLDGWALADKQVKNNKFSTTQVFNQAEENRKLVVKGLNDRGKVVTKVVKQLDVESEANIVHEKNYYREAVGTNVWKVPNKRGFFYEAEMTIDADGSPWAYHPVDGKGLDYLANAGHSGNWWGIATKNGEPVRQDQNDPAPGYYVSTTALLDYDYSKYDPNHYVNSSAIPFFVLPSGSSMGAELGDYGVVYNQNNGKLAYAIYADIGPTDHIGEGSIALAEKLEVDSDPKSGGAYGNIIYLVFPDTGAGQGTIPSKEKIKNKAEELFADWGGRRQLKAVID